MDQLDSIHPGLRHLAVPIGELTPDPANARQHDERNLAAIRGSLRQFGQRLPVVVQRSGYIVRAGNGRLLAAIQLGWSHLAAVVVDDDQISAVSFAIADNRTAELADWDAGTLERLLHEINIGDPDLQEMFSQLAADTGIIPPEEHEPSSGDDYRDTYQVLVTCRDEQEQRELLDRLLEDGLACRALVG